MEHKGGDNQFWKGGRGYPGRGFREEVTSGLGPGLFARWIRGVWELEGMWVMGGEMPAEAQEAVTKARNSPWDSGVAGSEDGTRGWRGRQRPCNQQLRTAQRIHK